MKKTPGIIEYLLFNKITLSAILASLMASFLFTTAASFTTERPVNAEQFNQSANKAH